MEKINKMRIFLFVLFLAIPLFAEGFIDGVAASEEDVVLEEELDEGVLTGEVTSLDLNSGGISIKTSDGLEKEFLVVDGETILWKGIEDIELADISEGEEAEVGYYADEGGKLIASWVDVLIEEEMIPAESVSDEESEEGDETSLE